MDKELLDLLNQARQIGANETQLQGIVDSYNLKKKSSSATPTTSLNGQSTSPSQENKTSNPFDVRNTVPDAFNQPLNFKPTQQQQPQPQQQQPTLTPENNFGMASANDLARQNVAPTDNPTQQVNAPQQAEQKVADTAIPEAQKQATNLKVRNEALDNATDDYFKTKGINAPKGSALYNQQRNSVAEALKNGLVSIGKDANGNYGVKRHSGFWENLKGGFNNAVKSNDEANDFVNNMTTQQRLDYLKQNPDEEQKHEAGFIGVKPNTLGQTGNLLGGGAPFMAKAVAGTVIGAGLAAVAPETGGVSLAALPAATSFLFTAPDLINQNAKDEILRRFQIFKSQGLSDEEAMDKADQGKWVGGLTGLATAAAFSGEGVNKALSPESKTVIGNAMEHVIKPSLKVGAITGLATAAGQEEGNLEGVKTSQQDIFNNSMKSLEENGTSALALTGLMHYAPKVLSSAFKYALTKDENPNDVQATLQANEDKGNIPQGTTEKTMQDLHEYADALKETPDGLNPQSEASYAGLVVAKNNLKKEMLSKDENAAIINQPKIDAINGQLQKIIATNKPYEAEVDEVTGQNLADQLKQANEKENEVPNTQAQTSTANGEVNKNIQPTEEIKIGEMIDKPITYNGERATLYQDGQTVVAKIEGKNKEFELGNIDEIKNHPISDYGIEHETSVVKVSDEGNINVRGEDFVNNFSDPLQAINKDKDGNIVSVNLENKDGQKRTFRGNIAEDIAYQIHLKEINKDNETRNDFEQHLETNAEAKQQTDGEIPETATQEPIKNNEPISREKAKPIKKTNVKEQTQNETPIEEHPEIKNLEKERNAEIEKEGKPDVKLKLITAKELSNSKDAVDNKLEHTKIVNKYKALKELINCL